MKGSNGKRVIMRALSFVALAFGDTWYTRSYGSSDSQNRDGGIGRINPGSGARTSGGGESGGDRVDRSGAGSEFGESTGCAEHATEESGDECSGCAGLG